LLISLVSIYGRKWSLISKSFYGGRGYHCHLRYRSINPRIKRGAWEKNEDQKIIEGIKVYGKQWCKIANKFFSDRTGKQIRDRYTSYLDPAINKNKFSTEEDLKILKLHNKYGNKWNLIRQFVPGRSGDCIKNRFNSSIKRNKKLLMVTNSPTCDVVSIFNLTINLFVFI
jgi:hypothetical protein